jgi:hypothetical protein
MVLQHERVDEGNRASALRRIARRYPSARFLVGMGAAPTGLNATVTRMPGKHRVSADQAMLFIANIRERIEHHRA